jgi:hypothetical protein
MSDRIVMPTGEIVEPEDLDGLIRAYRELKLQNEANRDTMGAIRDCLAYLSSQNGSRTLEAESGTAEITFRRKYTWHVDRLEKLKGMGLPPDRYAEMVRYVPKVNVRVADQVARTNPEYAATIADSMEVEEIREVRVS